MSIHEAAKFRDQLLEFAKYVAEITTARMGPKARDRLTIKGSITYLSLIFTIKLDGYESILLFPKHEKILTHSEEFEKLFRAVLGSILKVMLKNKQNFKVEYKEGGNLEFTAQAVEKKKKKKKTPEGWSRPSSAWYTPSDTNSATMAWND